MLKERKFKMVIATIVSFPTESAKEVAERFSKVPPFPDYLTRRGPYISATVDEGVVNLSIYELDNSKLSEGLVFIGDYIAGFFGVPGLTYEIKPLFEIEEALKMIGMG
jgi:hypothetical protein